MEELFKNAPDIIQVAAANPLTMAALVVLTLGVAAYGISYNSHDIARVAMFGLAGIGMLIIAAGVAIGTLVKDEIASSRQEKSKPLSSTPVLTPVFTPAPAPAPSPDEAIKRVLERMEMEQASRRPKLATVCVTEFGSCPFPVPTGQAGQPCTCSMADGLLVWHGTAK